MCGIAGSLSTSDREMDSATRDMVRALHHRGPDSEGFWQDPAAGVALGHARLAIVDLSPQGHQPMLSRCGRYVITFNGEIYNHLELRRRLPAQVWRGHSDTETLLAWFSDFGVVKALPHLVGMFAFAVWDRQALVLTLARDRMGEKPLYYGRLPSGDFVFASELKGLRAHPRWHGEINRDAVALYMRHNTIPAPYSIYRNISKLAPGSWIVVSAESRLECGEYWNTMKVAQERRAQRLDLPDVEAVAHLEEILGEAVSDQMMSDVPLGAFLSGGVDSSAIVALMCKVSAQPVRTFSVGFTEQGFNEAEYAKAVARHLGTDHTELYVTPKDAMAVIPKLPTIYDEPFSDSSQIPTFLVAEMARRDVTVSLSGDAGDELFGGYNRYLLAERMWKRLAPFPMGLRKTLACGILGVSPDTWQSMAAVMSPLVPALKRYGAIGDKLHKFASSVLPVGSPEEMYRSLVSHWQQPSELVLGSTEPSTVLDNEAVLNSGFSVVEQMCLLDQMSYLPDDILVKVDRAAMANGLETRVPMLDHRVVEFAWRLPMHQKIRNGETKWLLRQMLYRHVPKHLIERPKQGFGVPLDAWLRGPLRDWGEALLAPAKLRQQGLLNAELVQRKWHEHQTGKRNWQHQLWDVLMFQAWLEQWG